MSREYGANMSMFNLRACWARTMLKEGASGAEVREKHGGFVLRVARDELAKIKERRPMKQTELQSPDWR